MMVYPCDDCTRSHRDENKGTTPLMRAAKKGHYKCVKAILRGAGKLRVKQDELSDDDLDCGEGAAVNKPSDEKKSTNDGKKAAVVDVNSVDMFTTHMRPCKNTALSLAAEKGNHGCAKLLLRAGATVNIMNSKATPLMLAARWGHERCVELLVEFGASVNKKGWGGHTALSRAVEHGHTYCADYLLRAGAAVNVTTFSHHTPLMYAAGHGHYDCVKLLILSGADVNRSAGSKDSAITEAARYGHSRCLHEIILAGTNHASLGNPLGKKALLETAKFGHSQCVQLLLNAKVKESHASKSDQKERSVLDRALLRVARHCDAECVSLLIEKGANVNYRGNKDFSTPLIAAAKNNSYPNLLTLIEAGANMNLVNMYNLAPLFVCVETPDVQQVKLLLRSGAQVNGGKVDGYSALQYHLMTQGRVGAEANMEVCMLLYAAGEKLPKDNKVMIPRFLKRLRRRDPRRLSLMNFCRTAVRRRLLRVNVTTNLFLRAHCLGLPTVVAEYLLYNMSVEQDKENSVDCYESESNSSSGSSSPSSPSSYSGYRSSSRGYDNSSDSESDDSSTNSDASDLSPRGDNTQSSGESSTGDTSGPSTLPRVSYTSHSQDTGSQNPYEEAEDSYYGASQNVEDELRHEVSSEDAIGGDCSDGGTDGDNEEYDYGDENDEYGDGYDGYDDLQFDDGENDGNNDYY